MIFSNDNYCLNVTFESIILNEKNFKFIYLKKKIEKKIIHMILHYGKLKKNQMSPRGIHHGEKVDLVGILNVQH